MTKNHPMSLLHPAKLLCTWFGAGLSPKAPGTAGSLAALPFAYVIQVTWGSHVLLLASLVVFFVGCVATGIYLKRASGSDPGEVVIDEVAGQWFLLSFLYPTLTSYAIGFALFRCFDVLKPWPVSWADRRIKGGLGVMLDDMLAAAYPLGVLALAVCIGSLIGRPLDLEPLLRLLRENYVP